MLLKRRQFLKSAGWAAAPLLAQSRGKVIQESDPANAKLCTRLDARGVTDDDLLFLQQIGLPWGRLEFGEGDIPLDPLRAQQQPFAPFRLPAFSSLPPPFPPRHTPF